PRLIRHLDANTLNVKRRSPDDPSRRIFAMPSDANLTNEFFQVKRHCDLAVIVPTAQVEDLPETLLQPAAELVLAPLKEDPPNQIIVDLSDVSYFGSAFITFLLRCHHLLQSRGSEL